MADAYKIMIVDDQEVALMLLEKILRNNGYEVSAVLSGEECLECIYKDMPDLVILDIDMPGGMSGYEVCASLRDNPVTESTPVFFLSSHAEDIQILHADEIDGADEYLTKPINKEDLLERIETVLSFRDVG